MKHTILLICAALAGCPPLAAEIPSPAPGSDRLQFEADWYASIVPKTALDMVRQTPGFTLEEGDQRRGLAGGLGNVLVDGRRPSTKNQTLENFLGAIPARQVLRIEILRGAAAAGDASGRAVLLNIVRAPFTGQGFGSLGFEYAQQDRAMPNGALVWTGRAHSVDLAVGATAYTFARELPGTRRLTDVFGQPSGTREDKSPRDYGEYALNGEAAADLAGGRLRLTGKASYSRYHEDSAITSFDANRALTGADINPFTQTLRGAELGGQFDRQFGGWQLSSVVLLTRNRDESGITSTHVDPGGGTASIYAQDKLRDAGESVLRTTLSHELSAAHRLEFGLEGAFNTLDANLAVTLDLGGGPFGLPIANSNVQIEERRADAFVSDTWRMGKAWTLEARLAGEYSRLEFTGDSNQRVELAFAKPRVQLTRAFGDANQWRIRVERDVGQLDFTDFVSSVAVADKRVDGGNPDLRPQSQWSLEVGADLRPAGDVGISVTTFYGLVSDTADFTPVGPPGGLVDAPGNIGDSKIYGAHVVARAPLRFMRGASLNVDATWQHSAVTDPLTRRMREISEFQQLQVNAGFRQDLPTVAWGINYLEKSRTSKYLLAEIERNRVSPSLDVFAELPLAHGIRVRAAVISLLGQAEQRDRLLFDTDRTVHAYNAERGERNPSRWFQLSISGTF